MKVPNLFSWQRSLLLLILCHEVAANTEIITFSPSRERPADRVQVGNGSKLDPSHNERQWTALPTPLCDDPEAQLWVLLDLDDDKWAHYASFTLRLSWPASAPGIAQVRLSRDGRWARVHAVAAGVAAPPAVPLRLVLEPALFGVLPVSLVPTVATLVVVVLAAAWLVPQVTASLEPYARQARADLKTGMTRTRQE